MNGALAASQRLGRLCDEAIEAGHGSKRMPEVGGKSIAAEFSLGIAGIKKVADALKLKAAGAVTEFMAEAKNLDKAADRVISEASEMRRAAAEILGNEVETTADRPQVNGADQTKTT